MASRVTPGILIWLAALAVMSPAWVPPARAEEAVQVKDINTRPRVLEFFESCTVGDKQLLFGDDGVRGQEIWIGDGLIGTSRLLKDINPGRASSFPNNCTILNGIALFRADDGVTGSELWRSDGTEAGTFLLKDINPGPAGSSPFGNRGVVSGNRIFFAAQQDVNDRELWISDGTSAGTVRVKDINPGATGSFPENLILLDDGRVFLRATAPVVGNELFVSDGTDAGTVLVKDINPGISNSFAAAPKKIGGTLLFSAIKSGLGRELWRSDGTEAGTSLVKDISPGSTDGVSSSNYEVLGDRLFFAGKTPANGIELWLSDGTEANTNLLVDIDPGANTSFPSSFRVLNGKMYFDASSSTHGREPWISDGTPSGTVLLSDIGPGALDGVFGSNDAISPDGSRLVFSTDPSSGAPEIFSTNGTSAGTQPLLDTYPGTLSNRGYVGAESPQGIALGVPVPMDSVPGGSYSLTDGTPGGTIPHPGTLPSFTDSASPVVLGELNGRLILAANDGVTGYELWSSDGTEAGTTQIADINPGPAWFVDPSKRGAKVGDFILFVGSKADTGAELWRTDGTAAGTQLVKDIEPGTASAFPVRTLTSFGFVIGSGPTSKVIFGAETAAQGLEPWVSDGTAAGTQLLRDIFPGTPDGLEDLQFVGAVNSSGTGLFFTADDGVTGYELWFTNGVPGPANTALVADIRPGAAGSAVRDITALPPPSQGVVYSACNDAAGCEFWVSQTAASAFMYKDLNPGPANSTPGDFVILSPSSPFLMVFQAADNTNGRELWKSDGTFAGTVLLKDIATGPASSDPDNIKPLGGGTALFRACANGGFSNCELWRTNGTAGGTTQVIDLRPGADSSDPRIIGTLNGVGYFYAFEPAKYGIYRSDGTAAGTRNLVDLSFTNLGIEGLSREPAVNALASLFFLGGTSAQGFEIFKIADDQCPADPNKTFPGICGCGVVDELDGDGDGSADCQDQCPVHGFKFAPGQCGCETPDTDSDLDGTADCVDQCAADGSKTVPGTCGCGVSDGDLNSNGVADCLDTTVLSVTPPKAKLKLKKNKLIITMTARPGVRYVVLYNISRTATSRATLPARKKRRPLRFRTRLVDSNILTLKKPKAGSTIKVKYIFEVPGPSPLRSLESALAAKKIRR